MLLLWEVDFAFAAPLLRFCTRYSLTMKPTCSNKLCWDWYVVCLLSETKTKVEICRVIKIETIINDENVYMTKSADYFENVFSTVKPVIYRLSSTRANILSKCNIKYFLNYLHYSNSCFWDFNQVTSKYPSPRSLVVKNNFIKRSWKRIKLPVV